MTDTMTTTATTTHADAAPTTTPAELTPAGSSTATTTGRTPTTRKRGHYAAIPNEIITDYARRTYVLEVEDKKTKRKKTQEHTLGAIGVAVYAVLAMHADRHTRKCYPGIRQTAKKLDLSYNCVQGKLKGLELLGLIEVTRNAKGKGETGSPTIEHTYRLLPIDAPPLPPDGRGALPPDGVPLYHLGDRNQPSTNKPTTTRAKHPPKIATGGPVFGGGGADSNLAQDAQKIMRALMACEVSRAKHTEALAARIAAHPHALEVIEAEYAAVKGKSRNAAGALYSRLNNMTPADWAARAQKARPVVRMKEIPK